MQQTRWILTKPNSRCSYHMRGSALFWEGAWAGDSEPGNGRTMTLPTEMLWKKRNFECCHLLDTAPCSPYVNWRFAGKYHFHLQGKESAEEETSVQQILPSHLRSPVSRLIFILKMEVILSCETSFHIRTSRYYSPEDGNIHNYRCENIK
jgi:hypothetical protein